MEVRGTRVRLAGRHPARSAAAASRAEEYPHLRVACLSFIISLRPLALSPSCKHGRAECRLTTHSIYDEGMRFHARRLTAYKAISHVLIPAYNITWSGVECT